MFPAYPRHKDSGATWLGVVPEHWNLKRFGYYFSERREKVSDKDLPALSVTKNGVVPQLDTAAKSDDGDNRKRVSVGDFVINSRSDRKGAAGTSAFSGSVSLICTVLKPHASCYTPFVHYLLRSQPFQEEFYRNGKGIVADLWSTSFSEMRNIRLAMPPFSEQVQIAGFLDGETAKIDALVAEQRHLMGLLKEKQQAVVSHAVTKGLNADSPMKPSGIEWLGDVPRHWRVGRCGFYLSLLSGYAFPSTGFSTDETNPKLLRGINVGVNRIKWDDTEYWQRSEADGLDMYELREGDLVIGMDRPLIAEGMLVARIGKADLPCLLLQRVVSIKVGPSLNADYLMRLLSSDLFAAHFTPETTGVSVPHISPEQIYTFIIPIPPVDEQNSLVAFIASEFGKLEDLRAEAERSIRLLEERRNALISAVVTGQVDVRCLGEAAAA
jgi:type I restriction enzyme, S subunit